MVSKLSSKIEYVVMLSKVLLNPILYIYYELSVVLEVYFVNVLFCISLNFSVSFFANSRLSLKEYV